MSSTANKFVPIETLSDETKSDETKSDDSCLSSDNDGVLQRFFKEHEGYCTPNSSKLLTSWINSPFGGKSVRLYGVVVVHYNESLHCIKILWFYPETCNILFEDLVEFITPEAFEKEFMYYKNPNGKTVWHQWVWNKAKLIASGRTQMWVNGPRDKSKGNGKGRGNGNGKGNGRGNGRGKGRGKGNPIDNDPGHGRGNGQYNGTNNFNDENNLCDMDFVTKNDLLKFIKMFQEQGTGAKD